MPQLQDEIDANQANFFKDWTTQAVKNWTALAKNAAIYRASYRRLTTLQALKTHLIVPQYKAGSAAFFFEAHNDSLVSHVAASTGAWRSALHALRSCIENTLNAIYFNDHPVELELWGSGKFLMGCSELIKYAEKHPRLSNVAPATTAINILRSEYTTLSKAVHASAVNFRMTDAVSNVLLWNVDPVKAAMWATREKRTIEGVTLLMVSLHANLLQGTGLTPLRNVLYFSLGPGARTALRTSLRINIPPP